MTDQTITITVTIPGADVVGLINDFRVLLKEFTSVGLSLEEALVKLRLIEDAATAEIPQVQTSVQEVADAVKEVGKEVGDAAKDFKFSGPMGIHGGTS
jgi:predicted amino acid-binding ACT domain protein